MSQQKVLVPGDSLGARSLAGPVLADLRPEAQFLLCCARLELSAHDRERILRWLRSGLDWPYLLELAKRHGLRALLYLHLDALGAAAVPKDVFVQLWGWYQRASGHNKSMARELLHILQRFETSDIPAVPFRGPALAAAVYRDLALREFADLDILLRRQDAARAAELLVTEGYVPEFSLKPAGEAAFLRSSAQYHRAFIHPASSTMIELHWKTDLDFPVECTDDWQWWADLGTVDLPPGRVRSFEAEELLLILCLHGSKHHWASLGWLVDVAELIRQQRRLDWDCVWGRAHELACTRRLAVGLHLAHRLLEAPVPPEMQNRIAAVARVQELAAAITPALFEPEGDQMDSRGLLRLNLELYESPRQRLRHFLNVVFVPGPLEWSRWPLPTALFPLYYPIRLLRLIGKQTRELMSRSRR